VLRPGWRLSSFWRGIRCTVGDARSPIRHTLISVVGASLCSVWATAPCAGNAHPVASLLAKVACARHIGDATRKQFNWRRVVVTVSNGFPQDDRE
jgi:hypothetical protein